MATRDPIPAEHRCPWCGYPVVTREWFRAGRGMHWQAVCSDAGDCDAFGPRRPTEAEAIAAFCGAVVKKGE